MTKNFEDRLQELTGADIVKAAKSLLRQNRLVGAWRDSEGRLCGTFQTQDGFADVKVKPGQAPTAVCSCRPDEEGLCEHAVALIQYGSSFKIVAASAHKEEEKAKYYGGLRSETLPELVDRARTPGATLTLEAISAFPHAPSKWENAKFSVKLSTPDRTYLGNLNNLRQLYFEKSLTVTLKYEAFSLQDQQIIRYLASQGEAEGPNILLNAEMTAEFFHSLVDYPRFWREGRQLWVRGDRAEPVLIKSGSGASIRLSPGVRVHGATLPVAGAKVITGRSGCWIGHEGEYFFLPATCEVSFMRSFFRSAVQTLPEGVSLAEFLEDFSLPVVDTSIMEPEMRRMGVFLDSAIPVNEDFLLNVSYLYPSGADKTQLPTDAGHLVREGDRFWKRDGEGEHSFENDLNLFGFTRTPAGYRLRGIDRIGTFLDGALPAWMNGRANIGLSGRLMAQLRGNEGLPVIGLNCKLHSVGADYFLVSYRLTGLGSPVAWEKVQSLADDGKRFLLTSGGLVKLDAKLQRFFGATASTLREIDTAARTFQVPFYAAGYFISLVKEIPGAMVPEIAAGPDAAADRSGMPDFRFEGTLRKYQEEGVRFLRTMTDRGFNVVLADEMGLGKTVQLLALLADRQRRNDPPALIVCPASLVENWAREAHRFVPDFRVAAPSTGTARLEVWKNTSEYDLIVLSYAAARFSAEKIKKLEFSYLVLDEAQHIKNPGSCNARNCKSISAAHRIVLSGTPLENSQEDLWSIFDFLHPGMLGTLTGFRRQYGDLKLNRTRQQELAERVAPFIKRRTKAMIAKDLPPKTESTVYCEMEEAQRALYEQVRAEGLRLISGCKRGDVEGNTAIFTTLLRLRQICCHPALLPDHQGDNVPSAKTELLLELLHENVDSQHKMLLFSQFTSLLSQIITELEKDQIPFEYLDGSTPARSRMQKVDNFNKDPSLPLFLLSLKAGGTGLNLTGADTVIIYDPWWNPAVELQAADRTHRIGQKKPVTSLKLVVKDSIEEKILELQSQKQQIFDSVIDNPEAAAGKFTLEELRFLLH